jgi:hypothetical protein
MLITCAPSTLENFCWFISNGGGKERGKDNQYHFANEN